MTPRKWTGDLSALKARFADVQTAYRSLLREQITQVVDNQVEVSKRIQKIEKQTQATSNAVNKQVKHLDYEQLTGALNDLEAALESVNARSEACCAAIRRINADGTHAVDPELYPSLSKAVN